jgi:hypothetical protein
LQITVSKLICLVKITADQVPRLPKELTTIAVSKEVYQALRNLGKTGDSFDKVLRVVLKVKGD